VHPYLSTLREQQFAFMLGDEYRLSLIFLDLRQAVKQHHLVFVVRALTA
jgi:hypothetical protein